MHVAMLFRLKFLFCFLEYVVKPFALVLYRVIFWYAALRNCWVVGQPYRSFEMNNLCVSGRSTAHEFWNETMTMCSWVVDPPHRSIEMKQNHSRSQVTFSARKFLRLCRREGGRGGRRCFKHFLEYTYSSRVVKVINRILQPFLCLFVCLFFSLGFISLFF